MKSSTATG